MSGCRVANRQAARIVLSKRAGWQRHRRRATGQRDGGEHRGQVDAAAGQPRLQPAAGAGQPAGKRVLLNTQLSRRLGASSAIQMAQDERRSVPFRQPTDFGVEQDLNVPPGESLRRVGPDRNRRLALAGSPPAGVTLCSQGGPEGDAMQPTRQGIGTADRLGLASQHEERGLERVFRVFGVVEHALTDPQDHRPVALHEDRER